MRSDAEVMLKTADPAADAARLNDAISEWKRNADEYHWTTFDIREFTHFYIIISNVIGYREEAQ